MNGNLKLAVIGLGEIAGKAYLPLLSTWPGVTLLACSRSRETVDRHLKRYPFERGTTNLEELIDWKPESALVLSPNPSHFEIAKKLLESAVDTYVEKPLALSSQASGELGAIAQKQGRVLMVGFNRRYSPVHQWVKERWGDRPVRHALLEKHRPEPVHADLETNYRDDVIHQIDLVRYFCGEAAPLSTHYTEHNGQLKGAFSSMSLASDGLALVATSRAAGRWRERYEIHGDGASVYIEAFTRARWVDRDGERVYSVEDLGSWSSHLKSRGFEGELKHFFQCVESRGEPRTSAEESVSTQWLLEGLLQVAERA